MASGHGAPLMEASYSYFEILRVLFAVCFGALSVIPTCLLTVSLVSEDFSPALWEVMMLLASLCSGWLTITPSNPGLRAARGWGLRSTSAIRAEIYLILLI